MVAWRIPTFLREVGANIGAVAQVIPSVAAVRACVRACGSGAATSRPHDALLNDITASHVRTRAR